MSLVSDSEVTVAAKKVMDDKFLNRMKESKDATLVGLYSHMDKLFSTRSLALKDKKTLVATAVENGQTVLKDDLTLNNPSVLVKIFEQEIPKLYCTKSKKKETVDWTDFKLHSWNTITHI